MTGENGFTGQCRQFLARNGLPDAEEIRKQTRLWFRLVLGTGRDMLLKAALIAALTYAVFYFVRALWSVYRHTPVGKTFILEINPVLARNVDHLLFGYDLWQLALHLTLAALYVCLCMGMISQLFFLKRYFFDARALPVRLLWTIGLSLLASGYLDSSPLVPSELTFVLVVPVVLLLQNSAFEFAGRLLPEGNLLALTRRIKSARVRAAIRDSFE
jgi:hypothetical protein